MLPFIYRMWIFLLFALGYTVHANVPDPTLIHIKVGNQPINLTSPGFPTHIYPSNLNTRFDITVEPNYYTPKLTIVSLHLKSNCNDYLQIVKFNRPIYTFCGLISLKTPFYFTSRHLLFIFRTNSKETSPGFQLTLKRTSQAPYYPLGRCGYQSMATSQHKSLYSPFAPYNYVDDMACTWTIAARRGYCVYLTIISFRTAIHDNLTVESEGQTPQVFTGTNYVLPIIHPLFRSPVYLRFDTNNSTVEQGFQIVYREHPSSNLISTQFSLPPQAESQTSSPSINNTLFSVVLRQLDDLIINNMLRAEKLEYIQSQLNDRLEDFNYQLTSHVRTIFNASCTFITNNFTAYTPPFPFYEYVMLSLSAISIIFSIFFLFFTCCLSRRLYHFYLVSNRNQLKTDSQRLLIYRPGKYTHALQYALILPLMSPACAKPLPPDNLFLALWNHIQ